MSNQVYLPFELKSEIMSFMSPSSLAATSRSSHAFSVECDRYLYRDVVLSKEATMQSFLKPLVAKPSRALLVRSIELRDFDVIHHDLVSRILQMLTNLQILTILPTLSDVELSVSWETLLSGCRFQLVEFSTSFDCDHALTAFLISQPAIKRYVHSGDTPPAYPTGINSPFLLPHLNRFRGNIVDLNFIAPGRPLTHVCLEETFAEIGFAFVLPALSSSTGPVQDLSLSFADPVSDGTLSHIHASVPHLQALELTFPFHDSDLRTYLAWGRALRHYVKLERLVVEIGVGSNSMDSNLDAKRQKALVAAWSKASSRLRVVCFRSDTRINASVTHMDQWTPAGRKGWSSAKVAANKYW